MVDSNMGNSAMYNRINSAIFSDFRNQLQRIHQTNNMDSSKYCSNGHCNDDRLQCASKNIASAIWDIDNITHSCIIYRTDNWSDKLVFNRRLCISAIRVCKNSSNTIYSICHVKNTRKRQRRNK